MAKINQSDQIKTAEDLTKNEIDNSHDDIAPTTTQILTGVGVQILNLTIFFVIFWFLLSKKIVNAFHERTKLINKVEKAEEYYQEKVQEARHQSDLILQNGTKMKNDILIEASILAEKRKNELLEETNLKAKKIVEDAMVRNNILKSELENNFAQSVKKTSLGVIKKLFQKDKNFQSEYIDLLVNEVSNK